MKIKTKTIPFPNSLDITGKCVVTVDLGNRMGISILKRDGSIDYIYKYFSGANKNARSRYIYNFFMAIKDYYKPDMLIYEKNFYNKEHRNFRYQVVENQAKISGIIGFAFYELPVFYYNNQTIFNSIPLTNYGLRSAKYTKREVKKRVTLNYIQKKFGIDLDGNEDLADSLLVLFCAKKWNFQPKPVIKKFS